MAMKRKTTTAIVAGVTAASLLLGGTFAWTSVQQEAKNEAIVDINPGARLHDDFNGTNKDVYVENFSSGATGVNIFARVRLDQYFEVGQDAGKNPGDPDRKADPILGTDIADVTTWVPYKPGDTLGAPVQANDNWQWKLGHDDETSLPYYMPTFNKNKDSLLADINGTYEGTVIGDIGHYDDYKEYDASSTKTDTEVYDHDSNTAEEDKNDPNLTIQYSTTDPEAAIDSAHVLLVENVTHEAKQISTVSEVITMTEWLELYNDGIEGNETGNFWVYDSDGWAYWANPIAPGETTGLLLDSISMSSVPDDNWYYGINVVGQFATGSDWQMFFAPEADGGAGEDQITEDAKLLMTLITGVEEEDTTQTLTLDNWNDQSVYAPIGTPVMIDYDAYNYELGDGTDLENIDISSLQLTYPVYNEETDEYDHTPLEAEQYTYSDSILTITDAALEGEDVLVKSSDGQVYGYIYCYEDTSGDQGGNGEVPLIYVNGADAGGTAHFGVGATFTLSCAEEIDQVPVEDPSITVIRTPGSTAVDNGDGTYTVTINKLPDEGDRLMVFTAGATLDGEQIGDTIEVVINPDLGYNGISIYLPSGYAGGMSPGFGGQFTASSTDVTWTITGAQDTDTQFIPASNWLQIGNAETAETIVLTARSTTDTSLYGTFNLKVLTDGMLSISGVTGDDGAVQLVPYDVREDIQSSFSDTYTWSVDPASGLSVDADGNLTATAAGTYTVTAASDSNSRISATIEVTVNDDLSITLPEATE